jgi:hypothetical protein
MKTILLRCILPGLLAASSMVFAPAALAQAVTVVGPVTRISLAADGKSAEAVLADIKSSQPVSVHVTDKLTLDKFKEKQIVEGDEVRAKFERQDGKNSSKSFRKTAGC